MPTLLGALAVGFVLGLLVRTSSTPEPVSRLESLREQLEESQENLRSLLGGLAKAGKKRYKQSAGVVRDTVDRAVDAAHDVDVDDYSSPRRSGSASSGRSTCKQRTDLRSKADTRRLRGNRSRLFLYPCHARLLEIVAP